VLRQPGYRLFFVFKKAHALTKMPSQLKLKKFKPLSKDRGNGGKK
jgi:hypothetical protein